MGTHSASATAQNTASSASRAKARVASRGDNPAVLAEIYRDNVNIAIWERDLSHEVQEAADAFAASNSNFQAAMTVSPESALASLTEALGTEYALLNQSMAELVEMFCDLLGLNRVGLRLSVLSSAMCPKFHVDRVPCRMITTFRHAGTEWLPHDVVDRSKLGTGSRGRSDSESGLYGTESDIQQLGSGDVALMKGELWAGNEEAGLVHRSPAVADGEARLLVTLDFSR